VATVGEHVSHALKASRFLSIRNWAMEVGLCPPNVHSRLSGVAQKSKRPSWVLLRIQLGRPWCLERLPPLDPIQIEVIVNATSGRLFIPLHAAPLMTEMFWRAVLLAI
jgi:hypothetical protein